LLPARLVKNGQNFQIRWMVYATIQTQVNRDAAVKVQRRRYFAFRTGHRAAKRLYPYTSCLNYDQFARDHKKNMAIVI
jgi:hypothetical protein